jgi:hypothetical protein
MLSSIQVTHGLQIGEEADLEAQMFIRSTNVHLKPNVQFSIEPAILPNCC